MFFRCFRWARFCQLLDDIDEKVKDLRADKSVQYRAHVGGGYFVSVTKGDKCMDFRKFYLPEGETEERSTRCGIALRLREWDAMHGITQSINLSFDSLDKAVRASRATIISTRWPLCSARSVIPSSTRKVLMRGDALRTRSDLSA